MPLSCKILLSDLGSTITKSSKHCSIQPAAPRKMGNMVRSMNSINMGPLPYFICCEVSYLIRTNVWNTTTMNMMFCKSTAGSFGKGFHEEKVNLYLDYFSKNKRLTLVRWRQSNILNLLPDSWFIPLKYGAI